MKLNKRLLVFISLILCASLLCACQNNNTQASSTKPDIDDVLGNIDTSIKDKDTNSDYSEEGSTKIEFSQDQASVKGVGASAQGADVRIGANGTYILSGSSANGSIIIDAGKNEVKLVFNGLSLANSDGPAILIKNAKKVIITLADGSNNLISDGSSYVLYEGNATVDGAIFSKSALVINGTGALTVNGNNAHGIVVKDGLTIAGGDLNVKSSGVGICGKDYIKVSNSNIKINAGTDGLRSDNIEDVDLGYIYVQSGTFDITSANDAIQAYGIVSVEGGSFKIKTTSTDSLSSAKGVKGVTGVAISGGSFVIDSIDDGLHSDGDILVAGGDISILSGDDGVHANDTLKITNGNLIIQKSYEGLEATGIIISGGYVEINSSDDGMNASGGNDSNTGVTGRPGGDMFESTDGSITISGGYVIVHNEGDGIDANGSLEISGGIVLVDGPSRGGNGSFDYATSAKITGGVVITLGVSDMAQNFSEATQGSILLKSNSNFSVGTVISLCDENGNVILAFTSTKAFNGMLFSAPELELGKTYTFYKNANVSGLDENGFAHNTTQTGGEAWTSVTLTNLISGQGSSMGGGGFPGGRPPR